MKMMLSEIREEAMLLPTMMSVDQEMSLIKQLMSIPLAVLHENVATFVAIMDRLYESHIQAFFDIDDQNRQYFLRFAQWLDQIANAVASASDRKAIAGFAEHFRLDPASFQA